MRLSFQAGLLIFELVPRSKKASIKFNWNEIAMMKVLMSFLILLLCSCTQVRLNRVTTKGEVAPLSHVLDPKNAFIRVKFDISTPTEGKYEKRNQDSLKNYVGYYLLEQLCSWDIFDSVHEAPTATEEKLHPKKYNDDYSLTLLIEETIKEEGPWRILRIITFGAYPQTMTKELVYKLELKDRRSGQVHLSRHVFQVDLSYHALVIGYPFDFNLHPITLEQRARIYLELIRPELYQMFGMTPPKKDHD